MNSLKIRAVNIKILMESLENLTKKYMAATNMYVDLILLCRFFNFIKCHKSVYYQEFPIEVPDHAVSISLFFFNLTNHVSKNSHGNI